MLFQNCQPKEKNNILRSYHKKCSYFTEPQCNKRGIRCQDSRAVRSGAYKVKIMWYSGLELIFYLIVILAFNKVCLSSRLRSRAPNVVFER